ncbi:MAG: copper amine oxidase N-terminal domain-containing protein [Dictyoglomi bacterium]|nr:copper amine oxidase N-terminal domain-containing protein [Dictyoglomota bacterium]
MKKWVIMTIILSLVVMTLPMANMVFASDNEYVKTGTIEATFPRVYGDKPVHVKISYELSISKDWNDAWPLHLKYTAVINAEGLSKTVQWEDDLDEFDTSVSVWTSFPDQLEYRQEQSLKNSGDKEEYTEFPSQLFLVIDAPPFWGGSDVGFKAWAKSQFAKTKVYLALEYTAVRDLNVWYKSAKLDIKPLNIPEPDGRVIGYESRLSYWVMTAGDGKYYLSVDFPQYSYYVSQSGWVRILWEDSPLLADEGYVYFVLLPGRGYRTSEDVVGYVYKTPYNGSYLRLVKGPGYSNYFIPYASGSNIVKNLLVGNIGAEIEPVKVIKKGQWIRQDDDTLRAFVVEYPSIPWGPVFSSRAYEYYYAWDKYEPQTSQFWTVGVQRQYTDNEGKVHTTDYFENGYACAGSYSDFINRGLQFEDTYDWNRVPAVDRALAEKVYGVPDGFLNPCYASRTFRYKWLADWFFGAIYQNAKYKYIPGNAYLEVKLGDKHIKAYRDGKDVSKDVDVPAQIIGGRMLVPVRHISEPLGAKVGWDGKERKVTIQLNGHTVEMWIDNPIGKVDGKQYKMPSGIPPQIVNNRTMVPLRFVAEALGAEVQWDFYYKKAIIKYLPDRYPSQ